MLKSREAKEWKSQRKLCWKFKHNNSQKHQQGVKNSGFIISLDESTSGRHVKLTNTRTETQANTTLCVWSGKNVSINQITYQKLIGQYQVTASSK